MLTSKQANILAAVVLFILVGGAAAIFYAQPVPPNLWVVADAADPLPGTPYSLDTLQSVSSRPLMPTTMEVVEPADFPDRMAADDGSIATLVFHYDVLDEVDPAIARYHFERGVQMVLIGGNRHDLMAWLGSHMNANSLPLDIMLDRNALGASDPEFWPTTHKVKAGGCGSSGGPHSLGGEGRWISPARLTELLVNHCEESRQRLLAALAGEPLIFDVITDEVVWFNRWGAAPFLQREHQIVQLTRGGEPFELGERVSSALWTEAMVMYPLMVTGGDHGAAGANVFDIWQDRVLLEYQDMIAPVQRDWPIISKDALEPRSPQMGEIASADQLEWARFAGAQYSPDGRRVAFQFKLYAVETGWYSLAGVLTIETRDIHLTRATEGQLQRQAVKWSPDGEHIAYQTAVQAIFVDLAAGLTEETPAEERAWHAVKTPDRIQSFRWHSDHVLEIAMVNEAGDEAMMYFDIGTGDVMEEPPDAASR